MQQFSNWVPEEVITYYEQLSTQEHPDSKNFERSDILVLRRCMESTAMEKAWQAINRRKEKSDPAKFANLIAWVSLSSRKMSNYPTPAQIATYTKLSKKARALSKELQALIDQVSDATREQWFGDSPNEYLEDLADRLDFGAKMSTIMRKRLTMLSGKPQSKSAKRTYIIRCISEGVQRSYGQPLHKVVALTSSEILQERVGEETARKLVS